MIQEVLCPMHTGQEGPPALPGAPGHLHQVTGSIDLGVAYPALYQVRGQVQVGLCSHLVMARCRMEDEVRQRGGVKLGSKGDVG